MQEKMTTCSDCKIKWTTYCLYCKQRATKVVIPSEVIDKEKKVKVSYKENNNAKKRKVEAPIQPLPINIDNFFISSKGTFTQLGEIPENFTKFFQSKGSEYYICEKNESLIRVSDHWGSRIRFCSWYLGGYPKETSWNWQKKHGKENKIGLIKFKDLMKNTEYHENRQSLNIEELESRHPF